MSKSQDLKGAMGMAKQLCGDGKMGGSGSGGGKKDGDVCDMALKMMKDMMKGVTDVKKISNDKKMALCKSYMAMDKGMMKRMVMCKSQDLRGAMGMAKQLCGDGKMGGSGSGGGKKDGDDFCSNAPAKMMKECKEAHMECMKSSSDAAKQKKCWYEKKKQLEEKAKTVDFCDHAQDDDTKKKCREEQMECMKSSSDAAKQKKCWYDK